MNLVLGDKYRFEHLANLIRWLAVGFIKTSINLSGNADAFVIGVVFAFDDPKILGNVV